MSKKLRFAISLILCAAAVFVFSFSATALPKAETAPSLNARTAILMNVNTGEIIYEKQKDQQVFPASSVKIMTALLALENIPDLDTVITVDPAAVARVSGNNISIKSGETFKARDLLYGLLVGTANDAATTLAVYISGSIENFVTLMNERAEELGAVNTVYKNPTGLHDPAMHTTAADTALIAKEACMNSRLMEISSEPSYTIPPTNKSAARTLYNKNMILSRNTENTYYYSGAKGLNAGNTNEAGYNLVTMATDKGMPLLCVVFACTKDESNGTIHSYIDAGNLFDWVFDSYAYTTVLKTSEILYELPVTLSARTDHVLLMPDSEIELLLPSDIDVKTEIEKMVSIPVSSVEAPILKGAQIGEVVLKYNGEIVGRSNLITADSVDRSSLLYNLKRVEFITSTTWFKVSAATFVFLLIICLIVSIVRGRRRDDIYTRAKRVRRRK